MEKLDKFLVLVSFLDPVEGALLIPATSKDDAALKATKLYHNRLGLNIVDVNLLSDIEGAVDPGETDEVAEPEADPKPTATIIPFPTQKKEIPSD